VAIEIVTLHVGLGTFSPIREDNIEKHKMHGEWAEVSAKTAKVINKAKAEDRRVVAVGTTSARTLEAFAKEVKSSKSMPTGRQVKVKRKIQIKSGKKEVDIFIKPGYNFQIVDGMITNFHLPKTTLLLLISALAGRAKIIRAYQEAINKKYKFFSFGDAMLII
jgi:S-adenosylmethionine:tRNA ribosyltransferase-isomerase